jgi:hypothetical protein
VSWCEHECDFCDPKKCAKIRHDELASERAAGRRDAIAEVVANLRLRVTQKLEQARANEFNVGLVQILGEEADASDFIADWIEGGCK